MRGNLGDKVRLQHILDAILEIEGYIIGSDFQKFMESSMMRFACIKQMEIIGEASNHISEQTRHLFTSIEWHQIIGMRNVFVHEYFGIDTDLVWEIIKKDLPDLKGKIEEVLSKIES